MKKMSVVVIGILFLSASYSYCAFFDIGEGARPQGMGKAFVAVADDANALFYNIAGITQIDKIIGTSTYTKLYVGLPGLNEGSAAIVFPLEKIGLPGYLGASATHFNLTDTSAASYRETTAGLSYAYRLNDIGFVNDLLADHILSVGVKIKGYNVKYGANEWTDINPVFGTNSDRTNKWGFGGDFSFFYQPPIKGLTGGVSIENIPQPDMGLDSENKIPFLVRIGAAYRVSEQLLTSFETDYRGLNLKPKIDQVGKFQIGTEYWFSRSALDSVYIGYGDIALRTGFGLGSSKYSNASAGFSYKAKIPYGGIYGGTGSIDAQLDYAFVWPFNFVEGLSGTHRVSLNIMESAAPTLAWKKKEEIQLEEEKPAEEVKPEETKLEEKKSEEVKPEETKIKEEEKSEGKGFFESIGDFFSGLWNSIF